MNTNAPSFTPRETTLATADSRAGFMPGSMKVFQIFRVKRLAAPIDMMAAGTSAPIAIAAKLNPMNQAGKILMNRVGTTAVGLSSLIPAAMAMYPSRPISPKRIV